MERLQGTHNSKAELKGFDVTETSDRPFDWVAALAFASGAVVVITSLLAMTLALVAVAASLF